MATDSATTSCAVPPPRTGGRAVDVGQQHDELVAAGAGDEVGVTGRVLQALGELQDQRVAGLVAERVVHELEVVQVEVQHRHAACRCRRARAIASSDSSSNIARFGSPVSLSWYAR